MLLRGNTKIVPVDVAGITLQTVHGLANEGKGGLAGSSNDTINININSAYMVPGTGIHYARTPVLILVIYCGSTTSSTFV